MKEYANGLATKAPDPNADVHPAIEAPFGSLENWADDFWASANAAGRAMLVHHCVNNNTFQPASGGSQASGSARPISIAVIPSEVRHHYIFQLHSAVFCTSLSEPCVRDVWDTIGDG